MSSFMEFFNQMLQKPALLITVILTLAVILIEAVRNLYQSGGDPLEVTAWSKLYDLFEDCCDACEIAADELETVVMKNS